jgi:Leucine-rich repeat (LRR) protein
MAGPAQTQKSEGFYQSPLSEADQPSESYISAFQQTRTKTAQIAKECIPPDLEPPRPSKRRRTGETLPDMAPPSAQVKFRSDNVDSVSSTPIPPPSCQQSDILAPLAQEASDSSDDEWKSLINWDEMANPLCAKPPLLLTPDSISETQPPVRSTPVPRMFRPIIVSAPIDERPCSKPLIDPDQLLVDFCQAIDHGRLNRELLKTASLPLSEQAKALRMAMAEKDDVWAQVEHLNLENKKLKGLPPEIGYFFKMTHLSLGFNAIRELPDEICCCSDLQVLSLGHNELVALPDSINDLTRLQKIHLEHNSITNLPLRLGQLKELQDLDISFNVITDFSWKLTDFPQLTTLCVDNNPLSPNAKKWLANFDVERNRQLKAKHIQEVEHSQLEAERLESTPKKVKQKFFTVFQ